MQRMISLDIFWRMKSVMQWISIPEKFLTIGTIVNIMLMCLQCCIGEAKAVTRSWKKCYEIAENALTKLKDPVPEGIDRKIYVTENYARLTQDHMGYAYILFSQIVEIMEDKSLPDFKTYMKEKYFK